MCFQNCCVFGQIELQPAMQLTHPVKECKSTAIHPRLLGYNLLHNLSKRVCCGKNGQLVKKWISDRVLPIAVIMAGGLEFVLQHSLSKLRDLCKLSKTF